MIVRSDHFEFDRSKARETERLANDPALTANERDVIRDAGEVQPFFTEAASHCFYCGQKVTIPAVMWNGRRSDGNDAAELWLHPKCAEAFCARLTRDADELKFGKERADEKLEQWSRQQND